MTKDGRPDYIVRAGIFAQNSFSFALSIDPRIVFCKVDGLILEEMGDQVGIIS